jgi:vacuolar-type H+-ATPase subunit E/Vma4
MLSLDPDHRKRVCQGMLSENAEGGETVLPAKADREALQALVATMPEKRLTLSGENAAIDGGFILMGQGYEKDCSFRSLLTTVRDAEETAVYQLLFD